MEVDLSEEVRGTAPASSSSYTAPQQIQHPQAVRRRDNGLWAIGDPSPPYDFISALRISRHCRIEHVLEAMLSLIDQLRFLKAAKQQAKHLESPSKHEHSGL